MGGGHRVPESLGVALCLPSRVLWGPRTLSAPHEAAMGARYGDRASLAWQGSVWVLVGMHSSYRAMTGVGGITPLLGSPGLLLGLLLPCLRGPPRPRADTLIPAFKKGNVWPGASATCCLPFDACISDIAMPKKEFHFEVASAKGEQPFSCLTGQLHTSPPDLPHHRHR